MQKCRSKKGIYYNVITPVSRAGNVGSIPTIPIVVSQHEQKMKKDKEGVWIISDKEAEVLNTVTFPTLLVKGCKKHGKNNSGNLQVAGN